MKVIRITTEFNYGGIEKVFELHAKYHVGEYELVFLALGKGGSTEQKLRQLGYKVIVLNSSSVTIPSAQLILELRRTFLAEKPDVVHAAGAEANFHATLAAKSACVRKVICEEIGIPNHSPTAKLIFRFVYFFSERVIAISKAVEQYLVKSKEVPVDKVELLYNPIDEIKEVDEDLKEELLFSVVARLEPIKNLTLLLEAFYEIQKELPAARLNIIGDGSQRKYLQEQTCELKIEDKVSFMGFISNPSPLLAQSSYFVLPSLFEGFGLACIEAIQADNIVICTNSGGIPEFIEDGEQGFLFDPTSKESLISKILEAIELPKEKRSSMLSAAKRKTAEMFSPHKYVRQLRSLYEAG